MMKNCEVASLPEELRNMFLQHTKLGEKKIVSYLPLNTIENVMRMSLDTYTSFIEKNGGSFLIFREKECCIWSGAVYAFLPEALSKTLTMNENVLAAVGIPNEPTGFIRAIAGTWFEHDTIIIPLLEELFGDS